MRKGSPLPRKVALVGAGMSKFGAFADKNSRDLFVEAYADLGRTIDKGFNPAEIETLFIGNFSSDLFEKQGHTAPLLADAIGLAPIPAVRMEAACASGGVALRQAALSVAFGQHDVVLAGGVERMTGLPTSQVTDTLGAAADTLFETPAGFTFPGFYAAIATAYMHRYGMRPEHLMQVAIKNHENGALNPRAQFTMTIPQWMAGRVQAAAKKGRPAPSWRDEWDFLHDDAANPMVAWPLRLFDCSPITDGAACLLVVSEERARDFTDDPIFITGVGQASDAPLHDRADLTSLSASRRAAGEAYEMAGITQQDVRMAEVHDCFTIAEIIATEDIGFFAPGTGFQMVEDGVTNRLGARPVNSSGGLKAKGHPVGASGIAQAVEVFLQMRRQAGARQVAVDVPVALTHNVGATGSTAVVHVFQRG